MVDDPIIEAAEHALGRNIEDISTQEIEEAALAVLAAVTPLIRAAALEEAAQVAEDYSGRDIVTRKELAARIRALKEQP